MVRGVTRDLDGSSPGLEIPKIGTTWRQGDQMMSRGALSGDNSGGEDAPIGAGCGEFVGDGGDHGPVEQ